MPSGAKKRKAAKKKKEKQANHASSATHSHDDEVKHHEEKESDEWEAASPNAQEPHSYQHPFAGGEAEELKAEGTPGVRPSVEENKSIEGAKGDGNNLQKVENEEEGVIQIDREMKTENESENDIVKIEMKLHKGSSSSSSGSSSDDESHVDKEKTMVVEIVLVADSVKSADSLSQAVTQVSESNPVGEAYKGFVESVLDVDSGKCSKEDVIHIKESATACNSESSDVMELGLNENGETKLHSSLNTEVSTFAMDLGSQRRDDEEVLISEQNSAASSVAKGSVVQENEDRLSLSFNPPKVDNGNVSVNAKDSEFPESSDNQPLIGSAPRPAETTSWKSCCGLFELFTGSNR